MMGKIEVNHIAQVVKTGYMYKRAYKHNIVYVSLHHTKGNGIITASFKRASTLILYIRINTISVIFHQATS